MLNHLMKMRLLLCFSSGQLYSRKRKAGKTFFLLENVISCGCCAFGIISSFCHLLSGKTYSKTELFGYSGGSFIRYTYKLNLPDGSLVWLNAGSKVTYSQGFGVDDRKLTLEGEGYFEVAHNEKVPFEVCTKEVNLRVLGTKFNFKNYSNDEEVMISLVEGKVALQNGIKAMEELYLEPNERMVLNKLTGEMVKSKANVEYANIWRDNKLFLMKSC